MASIKRARDIDLLAGTGLTVGLEPIEIHVGFIAGSSFLSQTNDYSFDSAAIVPTVALPLPFKRWDRVLVYLDNELVWGTEPCDQARVAGVQH